MTPHYQGKEKQLRDSQHRIPNGNIQNPFGFTGNLINLDQIVIDDQLQQRVKLNHPVINEYATAYSQGIEFPPITVWKCIEDEYYYLVDGFHRVAAAKQAGINKLPFLEKLGTYREALLFSLSVNATHGLRRSNADKHKVVLTVLNDRQWHQWSDRYIAKITNTSHPFVAKIRSQLTGNISSDGNNGNFLNLTGNVSSEDEHGNIQNLTGNVSSDGNSGNTSNLTGNISSENNYERVYITKHGTQATMNVTNIGKSKSIELPLPNGQVVSEQWQADLEAVDVPEGSYHDDTLENLDNSQTDLESIDSSDYKSRHKKQKMVNPLSVGDKVKVKEDHYCGSKQGVVTQIISPITVMVAFEDEQRELIKLKDLDLPELSSPQKSRKKEIVIKEGLNYKAGTPGYGCKWYVEVEEDTYQQLQAYQQQLGTLTIDATISRSLEKKPTSQSKVNNTVVSQFQQLSSEKDNSLVNLSNQINSLDSQQKLLLVQKLIESDADIVKQLKLLIDEK